MSLVTRCPSCETVFRISTRDATVRAGSVRCGVCDQVFNALDALIRMEDLGPEPHEVEAVEAEMLAQASAQNLAAVPAENALAAITKASTVAQIHAEGRVPAASFSVPEVELKLPDVGLVPDTSASDVLIIAAPAGDAPAHASTPPEGDTIFDIAGQKNRTADPLLDLDLDGATEAGLSNENENENESEQESDLLFAAPSFLSRRAMPETPLRTRKLFIALSVVALLVLASQAVYLWRNELATRWPWANAGLRSACAFAGCHIDLPMQINAIAIESSELQAVPQTDNRYVFSALLRSRHPSPLRYPAIELSLTDASDQILARRVFLPEQYLDTAQRSRLPAGLAANTELPVKINFEVSDHKVIGYRVGMFYP